MSIVDHDGSAEFACSKDDVFEAILQAVSRLPGMQVNRSERLSGRISVKTGVSLRSWGETVPISVTEIAPGRTRVSITSTPKTGVLFGGLFDLGKNRENIERIFSGAAEVLTGKPAHSSVPTAPPASWVYWNKCTGGNYPGAAYCQWCAAPLATQPASPPAEPITASPQEVAPPAQDAGKKATPLATFGPSTGWVGKVITRQGDTFILEGHGPISAAAIMEYDRQGHLIWPYDGMRAWVASRSQTPAVVPAREAQPTTQDKVEPTSEPGDDMSDVSVVIWSCLNDSESCAACRALERTTWLPSASAPASAPLSACANPDGCRCLLVMEIAQEGSEEPADVTFLRRLGGVATGQQMAEYDAEQAAERHAGQEGRRRTDKASATVSDAHGLEKTDPHKAVAMYREGLAVNVAVYEEELRGPKKSRQPSHIHYAYNRLTMLLEKLGRGAEALKELEDHDALDLPPEGPRADLDAMEKRRERLAKKFAT